MDGWEGGRVVGVDRQAEGRLYLSLGHIQCGCVHSGLQEYTQTTG